MFKRSFRFITVLTMFFLLSVSSVDAAGITMLAPINGSSVKSKDILIIAKTSENVKEVEIKGIAGDSLKVKVNKGGFFANVKLTSENNDLTFSADDGSKTDVNIKVSDTDNFTYHPDMSEVSDCTSTCHIAVDIDGYSVAPVAPICYECHDANNDKAYVHGPVNMGVCGVCHMVHGSDNPSFLSVSKESLCNGCHDSLMSTHPEQGGKLCIECHDPHSSDSKFHMK